MKCARWSAAAMARPLTNWPSAPTIERPTPPKMRRLILGTPEPPPLDLATLPPPVGRVMRAMLTRHRPPLRKLRRRQHEETVLYGLAASKGVYEGPARGVSGPSEFGRIAKGDVLVTESTTEAFNILLPLLGGIVTDNGGLLSHAAIVAREYGIPGVVGTRDATENT